MKKIPEAFTSIVLEFNTAGATLLPYQQLKLAATWLQQKRINRREFLTLIKEMLRDDGMYDFLDHPDSVDILADALRRM